MPSPWLVKFHIGMRIPDLPVPELGYHGDPRTWPITSTNHDSWHFMTILPHFGRRAWTGSPKGLVWGSCWQCFGQSIRTSCAEPMPTCSPRLSTGWQTILRTLHGKPCCKTCLPLLAFLGQSVANFMVASWPRCDLCQDDLYQKMTIGMSSFGMTGELKMSYVIPNVWDGWLANMFHRVLRFAAFMETRLTPCTYSTRLPTM